MFNLHRTDSTTPSIIFGLGIHPVHDSVDGFAILTTGTEQRNVRFATELSASGWSSCGPLSWRVVEPMTTWHVALGPNPAGLEFDLTWRARAPAWHGDVTVANRDGGTTDASARGALMAGGGYGGHHGQAPGRDHLESDVYPLDCTVTQLTLDSSLTDRLATFDWDGTPGIGIFEFALTRSRSYSYRPTLAG